MEPAVEPVQQSFLRFFVMALGPQYAVLLPLAGLTAFVLTLVVVLRGRGTFAAVALLFIVPLPLMVGLYAALDGGIAAYTVIASSPVAPKPSEVATGISMALVAPWLSMFLMAPSYLVAMLGSVVRSFSAEKPPTAHQPKPNRP